MRRVIGCVLIMMATKAFAASGDSPRFSALPIPSDPKSVWLLDTCAPKFKVSHTQQ
jgi:hypothetical protein